jgi:Protein of unknown function (DUF1549)/Protein of unknown function (DUF1553)
MNRSLLIAALFVFLELVPARAADPPLREFIDEQVKAAWTREKITPAPLADDAEFLRRVYLDIIGIIPSHEEAKAFLDDTSADKRAKLIDRLLEHPRYALHQADEWDLVLFGRHPPGYETYRRPTFQRWLQEQFAKNVPYDKWVADILKAEGTTVDNGPPWFLAQYSRQPEDAAEKITQTFLGVQLQCARCHDHPFENWKQVDFYGMAAFLARLQVIQFDKKNNELKVMIGETNTGEVLFTGPASQQTPGKKGEPIKPKFLQGEPLDEPPPPKDQKEERSLPSGKVPPKPQFSRKDKLAEWVTARDNPYFARAVANRIWAQFMGCGIVHPVDNMSAKNRPSHPELLDACARALVEHNFDIKWYIRELCNSQTYQLASTGNVEEARPRWFERARVRPLSAEELLESWRLATGYDEVVASKAGKTDAKAQGRFHGVTWDYMVRFFGQPSNGTGNFQGGLQEHLYLNNGEVYRLIATEKGSLYQVVSEDKGPWEERVDRLYLSILSRPAKPAEKKKFAEFLAGGDKPGERLREAIWVLMTCSEFRFNH